MNKFCKWLFSDETSKIIYAFFLGIMLTVFSMALFFTLAGCASNINVESMEECERYTLHGEFETCQ